MITDGWLRDASDPGNMNKTGDFGSERDAGFAEFTTTPWRNAAAVQSDLSDAELASVSYSTAAGMLTRAGVGANDKVLVPGASGGVGGALVQLAKRCGAHLIALAFEAKHEDVARLGPDVILPRAPDDLRAFYLRDLTFLSATVITPEVMPNLIRYIEQGDIKSALAATYPLDQLRKAQAAFIAKEHAGNIVLTP